MAGRPKRRARIAAQWAEVDRAAGRTSNAGRPKRRARLAAEAAARGGVSVPAAASSAASSAHLTDLIAARDEASRRLATARRNATAAKGNYRAAQNNDYIDESDRMDAEREYYATDDELREAVADLRDAEAALAAARRTPNGKRKGGASAAHLTDLVAARAAAFDRCRRAEAKYDAAKAIYRAAKDNRSLDESDLIDAEREYYAADDQFRAAFAALSVADAALAAARPAREEEHKRTFTWEARNRSLEDITFDEFDKLFYFCVDHPRSDITPPVGYINVPGRYGAYDWTSYEFGLTPGPYFDAEVIDHRVTSLRLLKDAQGWPVPNVEVTLAQARKMLGMPALSGRTPNGKRNGGHVFFLDRNDNVWETCSVNDVDGVAFGPRGAARKISRRAYTGFDVVGHEDDWRIVELRFGGRGNSPF